MSAPRRYLLPLLAPLFLGAVLSGPGCSPADENPTDGNPVVVTVEVVPEAAVPGESVTLAWRFALAEDWHLYWVGRNDTGYPPQIDLALPEGWVAGGLQWPAPTRHVAAGDILDHVYYDELVLIQKIGAPLSATPGEQAVFQADIQWLACKNMCLPGRMTLSVSIPVRDRVETRKPNIASTAADRIPPPLPEGSLEIAWEGTIFHAQHPGARQLTFMPTDDCGRLVDLFQDGQSEKLALRFKPKGETVGPVRGLLTIEQDGKKTRTYRVDFPAVALSAIQPEVDESR